MAASSWRQALLRQITNAAPDRMISGANHFFSLMDITDRQARRQTCQAPAGISGVLGARHLTVAHCRAGHRRRGGNDGPEGVNRAAC